MDANQVAAVMRKAKPKTKKTESAIGWALALVAAMQWAADCNALSVAFSAEVDRLTFLQACGVDLKKEGMLLQNQPGKLKLVLKEV